MTTAQSLPESASPSSTSTAATPFRFRRLIFPLFSLVLLLALWPVHSYHPADIDYLLGGIVSNAYPRNQLGVVGAWLAWFMLFTFGLASYPIVLLAIICSCRRLFWPRGVRPISWEYLCAFLLFAFGAAMLLGIWQNAFSIITEALNIATIPAASSVTLLRSRSRLAAPALEPDRFCHRCHRHDRGRAAVISSSTGSSFAFHSC